MVALYIPSPGGIIVGGTAPAFTTYNPADCSTNILLTNGNLTVETIGAAPIGENVRTIAHHGSGIYYCETINNQTATPGFLGLGVANSTAALTNVTIDSTANGVMYYSDGGVYGNNAFLTNTGIDTSTNGDRIGVEVDVTNATLRIRKNGGTWSSAISISFITGDYYFVAYAYKPFTTTTKCTTNFGATAYVDTPTGSNW